MLYQTVGLLLVAAFLSFGLSWFFKIPVLALVLRLLLAFKSIKWVLVWKSIVRYFLTKAPVNIAYDIGSRFFSRLARGLGLIEISNRIVHRILQIWKYTGGYMILKWKKLPFWFRLTTSVILTTGLMILTLWNSWFLVLIVFMPTEVTSGLSLFISRYFSQRLANTTFMRFYAKSLVWFSQTYPGKVLHWLNERYEKHIGIRMEEMGSRQREKIEQSETGRSFVSWLNRHFPAPPLVLKADWRKDLLETPQPDNSPLLQISSG